ncbi:MAG: enoyl-CoA hydratase/isomerase family protein [Actinobacteria bacterium]|nr:enoyl-CoA hydratase/isomerase family protein [Actinomycetota bacterium]
MTDQEGEVRYEVAGGVARVTIDRPARHNALSWPLVARLREQVARAGQDPGVRVLVLAGAGERAFCAGADLTGMTGDSDLLGVHEARGRVGELFFDLWSLGKPTIARVQGFALAGGFGLALACDFVVAAEEAQFGTPEVDVGLWPFMVTVPMVRSMPPKKALELMLTGRRVGAQEGARIGFVNQVVPAAALDSAVEELAAVLASKPAAMVKLGRDSFYAVWDQAARDALEHLHPLLTLATMTDEAREGLQAFTEKRAPSWRGR